MTAKLPGGARSGESPFSTLALAWYLFFRLFFITLLLSGTILFQFRGQAEIWTPSLALLYVLIGTSYLHGLISAFLLRHQVRDSLFIHSQIVWDLLLVTLLIFATGVAESLFPSLYILIVLSASVFLPAREIFFVASASAILYGSLLNLQYYGYFVEGLGISLMYPLDGRDVFYAVFVHVTAYLISSLLGASLSSRLQRSQEELQQQRIDARELETLNRAIAANIRSGLMIVNPQGRIRAFNRAAEEMTGFKLLDIYDRLIVEQFPNIEVYDQKPLLVPRGEGTVLTADGRELTIGFSSTLVDNDAGDPLGLLVTFQDLTYLKKMEQGLKRADHLAAVGQLAAGLAHEIRNPLASMSGSVQLLLEETDLQQEERQLLSIVVREADRLNQLLTDFLAFARPADPDLGEVDLACMLNELVELNEADQRFSAVTFVRDYPESLVACVDLRQVRQALWNLMVNACEATPAEGGTVRVAAGGSPLWIQIEDNGPGIPHELQTRIFDPFFTTKERGSGLGLPTVHAIIEAHGGRITVQQGRDSGTVMRIELSSSEGECGQNEDVL
ncbi:MAG: PAS domain-containing sensor histidine kinase [Desulfuromonas sp.]|nr:MAG: PAS domain-containing sensor histidine kinase [Desulfuromonas sp.]